MSDAFAARYAVAACPSPSPCAAPAVIASLRWRPVSSAMPNCPGPRLASTSSDVAPASATSKSWIRPAPFIAMAATNPRSMRSMMTGASPALMTCAPSPQTTGAIVCARRTDRLDHGLKIRRREKLRPRRDPAGKPRGGIPRLRETVVANLALPLGERIRLDAGEIERLVVHGGSVPQIQ